MTPFQWNFPTKLTYGEGRVNEAGEIAKDYGKKANVKALLKGRSPNFWKGGRSALNLDLSPIHLLLHILLYW